MDGNTSNQPVHVFSFFLSQYQGTEMKLSIASRLSNLLAYSHMILCISVMSVITSTPSFLVLFSPFYFILNVFITFVYLFKGPDFCFIDLFYNCVVSILLMSALMLTILFYLLTLSFDYLSFSSSVKSEVTLFVCFYLFSYLFMVGLYCYNLLP